MRPESEHLRYFRCYEYSNHDHDNTDYRVADRVDSGLHLLVFATGEDEHESTPYDEEDRAEPCDEDNE